MDKEMHITKKEETNNKGLCTTGIMSLLFGIYQAVG